MGVFTATRFLAILTAGLLHPAVGIFISLFIIFVGSLVLVFTQQISTAAVWAGVILQAVNTYITLIWKLGQQEKKVQAMRLYPPSNLPISGLKFIEKQIF